MSLKGKNIGFIITSSFYHFDKIIEQLKKIISEGARIIPVMSEHAYFTDTKYGKASEFVEQIQNITSSTVIHNIQDAEILFYEKELDVIVIAPATGNIIAKLANGICDTAPTLFVKNNLKYNKPVVIALAAYDGLGGNATNIGQLLDKKSYYFVPFVQENPITKPKSLVFLPKYLIKTIEYALEHEQIQPILQ